MTAESAPITGAELDNLQALADAATPGPWLYQDYFSNVYTDYTGITVHIAKCNSQQIDNGVSEADANAKFIAAARVAVPRLIAEVRRMRAEVKQLNAALEDKFARMILEHVIDNAAANMVARIAQNESEQYSIGVFEILVEEVAKLRAERDEWKKIAENK
jgi:hypothetical protein